jgi:hypothetical protein
MTMNAFATSLILMYGMSCFEPEYFGKTDHYSFGGIVLKTLSHKIVDTPKTLLSGYL